MSIPPFLCKCGHLIFNLMILKAQICYREGFTCNVILINWIESVFKSLLQMRQLIQLITLKNWWVIVDIKCYFPALSLLPPEAVIPFLYHIQTDSAPQVAPRGPLRLSVQPGSAQLTWQAGQMMINAEEEKQLLDQLGVVGSAQGTHYQQTVEFGMHACSLAIAQTHSNASPKDKMTSCQTQSYRGQRVSRLLFWADLTNCSDRE